MRALNRARLRPSSSARRLRRLSSSDPIGCCVGSGSAWTTPTVRFGTCGGDGRRGDASLVSGYAPFSGAVAWRVRPPAAGTWSSFGTSGGIGATDAPEARAEARLCCTTRGDGGVVPIDPLRAGPAPTERARAVPGGTTAPCPARELAPAAAITAPWQARRRDCLRTHRRVHRRSTLHDLHGRVSDVCI